jgi:hypothetical protein
MKRMSMRQFGKIVARVMKSLPKEFEPHLDNVVVDVEEAPAIEKLRRQCSPRKKLPMASRCTARLRDARPAAWSAGFDPRRSPDRGRIKPAAGVSMPDVFRVKRSGLIYVAGPLDDGPAVGKNGELITLGIELE